MEGYSVTEAASVLGVPTERVWELLARGVLAGAPEGETGMRVYLQPRPAPAAPQPKAPNGNGGAREPERELSPFRELLTEFRNLTERYGQALLALGEARGEVASLRSRVDLLEARMDLRLPSSGAPAQAAAWSSAPMPFPAERTVMPTAPVEPSASEEAEHAETDDEEEERRARRRGPRRATESFAEALARAEDPSIPELPRGREAAAALAAPRADTEPGDLGLPREVPAAEPVPTAEEETGSEVSAAPDPVEPVAPAAAEPAPVETMQADPTAAPPTKPDLASIESVAREREPTEPEAPMAQPEPAAEPAAATATDEPAPAPTPEPVEAEPLEWDSERYTTVIDEPDWFAGEAFEAGEPDAVPADDIAEHGPQANEVAHGTSTEAAPEPSPAEERPSEQTEASRPGTPAQIDEESAVELDPVSPDRSGADEMEVASGGQRTSAPAAPVSGLPGSHELDEALAALDALAQPGTSSRFEQGRGTEVRSMPSEAESGFDEWPPRSRTFSQPASMRPGTPTTGPASRAYRRLRRIFPG